MSEFRLTQISDTHLGRRFPGLALGARGRDRDEDPGQKRCERRSAAVADAVQ